MSNKRYRQTSIFECFTTNKRPKNNCTSLNVNIDESLKSENRSEKTMLSALSLEDAAVNNVHRTAEDSVAIKSEMIETNGETSNVNAEANDKLTDNGSLRNTADLFSAESSSLEDRSVPSSSHSDELFPDSNNDEDDSENAATSEDCDSDEPEQLSLLNRAPDCSLPLPKLEPSANHTILFSPHIRSGVAPRPYPSSYRDRWDSDHVRMPCSPLSRYPVADAMGEKHIGSRWDLICQSLRRDIESSQDLEAAIMKYNSQYIGKWNFLGLHDFINKHLMEEEKDHFFEVILPVMVQMALDLPNISTQPVPLLKKGKDHSVTMTQKQIGCLLLNAFFCTYPRRTLPHRRHKERWTCEYATYPDINFNRLFYGTKNGIPERNAEKLKCLFNYFRRMVSKEPTGTVTFHRQSLRDDELPEWYKSSQVLRNVVIKSSGFIETDGQGMLQVDFANKFVGGGVIGQGCVQEEIRFIICPELIVSRLFVECLGNNEVLIITGVEQYSEHSGYGDSFKFTGNFIDETPRDPWGRRYTQLVAMDATHFKNSDVQFKPEFIKRELNKAYCAFYENASPAHMPAVATGNWGCGAFKGNAKLKFLIQLMAASETGRSLLYFTFGNKALKTELQKIYDFLKNKNLVVGDVWRLLRQYEENVSFLNKAKYSNLYDFIYAQFLTKEENCRTPDDENTEEQTPGDDSDKKAMKALIDEVTAGGSSKEFEDIT